MSPSNPKSSSGLLALKLIIGFLVVVLLMAILIPQKLWEEQAENEQVCRERMENLYHAARFHNKKTRGHTSDLKALLALAETDSVDVFPAGFKIDRLTREDSGVDSFQIEYFDPYQLFSHFQPAIDVHRPTPRDSVVLTIKPAPQFEFLPISQLYMSSDVPITVFTDDRGNQGIFTLVGAQGLIRYSITYGDRVRVPATSYIYHYPLENVTKCPVALSTFVSNVNVKIVIVAEVACELNKTPVDTSLSSSRLLSSIAVFRLLKEAGAIAEKTLLDAKTFEVVEDSLVQLRNRAYLDEWAGKLRNDGKDAVAAAIYDSLVDESSGFTPDQHALWESVRESSYNFMNEVKLEPDFMAARDSTANARKQLLADQHFHRRIADLTAEGMLAISESSVITTTADSVAYYSNPRLIKDKLFKARDDAMTLAYLNRTEVAELFGRFRYREEYRAQRVDSVGITIKCPIEGRVRKPRPSIFERIFAVEGTPNHGFIENGDLSWSERR